VEEVRSDDSDDEEDECLKCDDSEVSPDPRVVEVVREGQVSISGDSERAGSRAGESAGLVLGRDIRVSGTRRNDLGGRASEIEIVELVRENSLCIQRQVSLSGRDSTT
jgi:hypothetical protein